MTAIPLPLRPAGGHALAPRWLALVRPMLLVVVVVAAYHQSLLTLVDGLQLDTPLAHLALVPLLALALAVVRAQAPAGPDIHDRQVDWIIGLPLTSLALLGNMLLPARLSTDFWAWRVDLLTLPLFVAGAVTLLFGLRTMGRMLPAVLFLFLAWPWPYAAAVDRWLGVFSEATVAALRLVVATLPIATPTQAGASLFSVARADGSVVEMNVASACSGANGIVGFVLVGAAMLLVVRGDPRRKVLWLLTGASLVWLVNLARILVVFWAARSWGHDVAIDGFHPYVGLVVFNVAVLVMLALGPRFGLRLPSGARASRNQLVHRPRLRGALAVVLASAAVLAFANVDLRGAGAVTTTFGAPRLEAFADSREVPEGWELRQVRTFDWTRRLFGKDSRWTRYNYLNTGESVLDSNLPIVADVIETSKRSSLVTYGIEACYRFHGYAIRSERSVELGSGVVGRVVTYEKEDDVTWTALAWHWPVDRGPSRRYERVTLLFQDHAMASFGATAPLPADTDARLVVADRLRGADAGDVEPRVRETQRFLTAFGRDLVTRRAPGRSA